MRKSHVRKKKRHSSEFKAKVALEAFKGIKTINELAADYSLHPAQISMERAAHRGSTSTLHQFL